MASTTVGQTLVDVHVAVSTAPAGVARTLVGARSVTTHPMPEDRESESSKMMKYILISKSLVCTPARITGALINVLVAGESSPASKTAAGEAADQFRARAAVEAGVGGTLCHVLCAGGTLPAR